MKITRREFGQAVASGLGAEILPERAFPHPAGIVRRPNIVFICADQHTGRMLLGGTEAGVPVQTPNLKRLARLGMNFTNAYTVNPVCAPARAALMTGRFASDVGSYCNSTPFDGRVPTWGNYLERAGYYCWATGKMDLTPQADIGFKQVNTSHGHFNDPAITALFRMPLCYTINERKLVNGEAGEESAHDRRVVETGLGFLRSEAEHVGKPWAAYLGMTLPHPTFKAPQRLLDLYPTYEMRLPNIPPGYLENMHIVFQALRNFKLISTPIPEERIRRARSAYCAMITELDENVGRVLDQIENTGHLKDTLFIYTSDHGEMLGTNGLWLKNVLLEGAARVPLMMAGGGLPQGKTINTPVSHLDLVATLLDIAGIAIPRGLRGHSLIPLIRGERAAYPEYVYAESNSEGNCTGSYMIRKDDWKYIYFSWYGHNLLFNLREDPGEFNNLAGKPQFASIERELHGILTSLVNPDAITEQAFQKQRGILTTMVEKEDPGQFCHSLISRLGRGQAIGLAKKYFPKWQPPPSTQEEDSESY